MALGLVFSDLYGSRLNTELSSEDTTQLFTTVLRKKAINDAQDAFVRMTACTKRYASIAIVDGTQEYDLEALTDYIRQLGPPSVKVVKAGASDRYIQGEAFPRRDPEWLDRLEPGWRAASAGTPCAWYIREDGGSTYVGLHPKPDVGSGETWTLIQPYLADPADLTADGDEPFTISSAIVARLRPFHQALVHYAAAMLEPLRKNYSGYDRQMKLFAGYVANYIAQHTEDAPAQITLRRDYYGDSFSQRPPDWRTWP